MSEKADDNKLRPTSSNTSLTHGALKTGLRVAAKEALTPEQAESARREKPFLRQVGDEAIRLALKEPPMWEYRLYFQALEDFVQAQAGAAAAITAYPAITGTANIADWMVEKCDEYIHLADRFSRLVNTELQAAFGAPGEPGDAAAIVAVAKQIGEIYRRFIDIRNEARSQRADPLLEEAAREFSHICDKSIEEFEAYPSRSLNTLMDALADADCETEVVLHFEMKLKADVEPFNRALQRARQQL